MKRQHFFTISMVLLGLCVMAPWSIAEEAGSPSGKTAFLANKCNLCHSIESEKIEKTTGGFQKSTDKNVPPDLSTIGKKHNAAWMTKYLKKTEALNGVKHARFYRGSTENLEAITKWLETLK